MDFGEVVWGMIDGDIYSVYIYIIYAMEIFGDIFS